MASKFRGSQVAFNPTYFGITATSDTAGRWTANIEDIKEYYDGLQIALVLKTSYNSTYNTININGLGDVLIWKTVGARLTSHFGVNSVLYITYYSGAGTYSTFNGGFVVNSSYYTDNVTDNSIARFRPLSGEIINPYKIGMLGSDDKFYPFTRESGTGTTKTVQAAVFKLNSPILWSMNTSAIAAGVRLSNLYSSIYTSVLTYTLNQSFAAYTDLYLVGIANADDNTFVLDNSTANSWCTDTLPTTEDGKVYIYLGKIYSAGSNMHLFLWHPIYYYKDGALRVYNPNYIAPNIGSLINGAAAKTTPGDADMVGLMDSAAGNVMKKLSWANIKATLKTYFDTLYTKLGFYKVKVGSTYITATSNQDIIEFVAGTNVNLVADATGKKLTIAAIGGSGSAAYRAIGVNFQQRLTTLQGNSIHFFGTNGVQITPSFGGGGNTDLQLNFSLDTNNLIAFLGDLPNTSDLWESSVGVSFLTYGNTYYNAPNPVCGTDASSSTIEGFLTHYNYGDQHSFTFHNIRTNIMYISSRFWDGDKEEMVKNDWKRLLTCLDSTEHVIGEESVYKYVIDRNTTEINIDPAFNPEKDTIEIDISSFKDIIIANIYFKIIFYPAIAGPVTVNITNGNPKTINYTQFYVDPASYNNMIYEIQYIIWNRNTDWLYHNRIL